MNKESFNNNFTTLSQAVDHYQRLGYNHSFSFGKEEEVPENWCITGFFRFEGISNPSDNSIVYLLIKKDGSTKGIIVNAYGIYSSNKINTFIKKVMNCSGITI